MSKELVAGQKLQTYEIVSVLGEGGMSRVYLCEDLVLNRRVALKQLLTAGSDSRSIIRLQQEGQSLARLSHPNIVKILTFFNSDDGAPFLVMELLHGCSLAEFLAKNGSLSVGEVVKLAEQMCDALQHAHDAGIIHRDIKPTNIFLCNKKVESAKIIDFGIAKIADNSVNATRTGEFVGSPAYLSPEQAMQKPITDRSDQYSLGCVLYECLAGHPPFEDESAMGLILKHISDEAVPLGKNSFVPPVVAKAIERSLKKDPEARFASMTEFKSALEGKAVASQKNKLPILAIAVGSLLAGVLGLAAWAVVALGPTQKTPLPTVSATPSSSVPTKPAVSSHELSESYGTLEGNTNDLKDEHYIELKLQSDPTIEHLNLNNFAITKHALVTLSQFKHLKNLQMAETTIGDDAADQLCKIQTLGWLDVSKTRVGDAFVKKISTLPNLHYISLGETQVTSKGLEPFVNTKLLSNISVRTTKMDDSVADVLTKMPALAMLDIGKTGVGDEFVRRLSAKLNWTNLSLGGTQITQKSFPSLAKMKRLRLINLDYDSGITDLSDLSSLPLLSISLNGCVIPVNTPIVRQLSKFPMLEILRLSQTAIQDSDLLILAQAPKLKALEIKYCDLLTPQGIAAFKKLKPGCTLTLRDVERTSKYEKVESMFRKLDDPLK